MGTPAPSQPLAKQSKAEAAAEYVPFGASDPIKLTVSIVRDLLCNPTRSGKLCDDRQAMKFLMLCRSKKLNPFEGDAFLVGYDGQDGPTFSLITAHQAFLKRAENHPEFDGMESGVIVRLGDDGDIIDRVGDFIYPGDVLVGGWAIVHFKTRKHPTVRRLNFSCYAQDNKLWKRYPAGQIVKCAEADALRSSFPTLLGGLYNEEEMPVPITIQQPPQQPALQIGKSSLRRNGNGNGHGQSEPAPVTLADLEDHQPAPPDDLPQTTAGGGFDDMQPDPIAIREYADLVRGRIAEVPKGNAGAAAAELKSINDDLKKQAWIGSELQDELWAELRVAAEAAGAPSAVRRK